MKPLQLACLLLSVPLLACGDKSEPAAIEPSSRPVKLIEIARTSNQNSFRYPAVIGTSKFSELSFVVGGSIKELPINEADEVKAGDVIARLRSDDFQSNVDSARASFSNAEDEYQRAVRLAAQDAIAKNVLDQRKTQRDVARTQLDTVEKALADSVLRAPFDGVLASVDVRENQTVSPGSAIATIMNVEQLEATIDLPASVVAQVPTQSDRSAVVLLDAAPDREIEAAYSEAKLVADATSQTYSVTFSFTPPDNLLVLPGMNATVILRSTSSSGGGQNSVAVPLAAVLSDGKGQYVWVVDNNSMTVARRDIKVATGIGETVTIVAGLTSGEKIVGAGGSYLSEGSKVTPWTE